MKKIMIVLALTMLTIGSTGCARRCGKGLFGRRGKCCKPVCKMPCDSCNTGGEVVYEGNSYGDSYGAEVLPVPE